jgi:hypothetical protein
MSREAAKGMKENGDGWSKSRDREYLKRSPEAKAASIPGHRTDHGITTASRVKEDRDPRQCAFADGSSDRYWG